LVYSQTVNDVIQLGVFCDLAWKPKSTFPVKFSYTEKNEL